MRIEKDLAANREATVEAEDDFVRKKLPINPNKPELVRLRLEKEGLETEQEILRKKNPPVDVAVSISASSENLRGSLE